LNTKLCHHNASREIDQLGNNQRRKMMRREMRIRGRRMRMRMMAKNLG
jgi:hypothetical protein